MHAGAISDAGVRRGPGQLAISEAAPGPRNADKPTSAGAVGQVLVGLLDDLADASPQPDRSDAYLRGYSMGIRFARICVLDEIAAKSGSFVRASLTGGRWANREQARTHAVLRRIAGRLSDDFTLGGDDHAAGYRHAAGVALESISRLER